MQTTYWWRSIGIVLLLTFFFGSYIGPCEYSLGRCLGGNSIPVTRTLVHFVIALLIISPSLFFVSDSIFKKWLRFSAVWFLMTIVFIVLSPEYRGGWLGFGPEKESVSVFMSISLVILSFGQLTWESWKERKLR